jgi:hypothetical protein
MKKLSLLFLISAFFTTAKAQEMQYGIKDTFNYTPVKGLVEYYKYVDTAEMKIVEGKPDDAVQYYMKAFQYKKMPFSIDENRALVLTSKSKPDTNLIRFCMIKDFKYKNYYDNSDSLVNNLKPYFPTLDPNFFNRMKFILDTVKRENVLYKEVKEAVDSMHEADQEARMQNDNTKMEIIDSLNLKRLMELYKKYGNITDYNTDRNTLEFIRIILYHNHQVEKMHIWYSTMLKQVMNGSYPARLFIELMTDYYRDEHNNENVFGFCQGLALVDKYVIMKLAPSKEKKINNLRAKLMVEPYMNQQKKLVWEFYHPHYEYNSFYFYVFKMIFSPMDACTPEEIAQNKIVQENKINELKEKYGKNLIIIDKKPENYDFNKQ